MLPKREITKRSKARLRLAQDLYSDLEKRLPVINKDILRHITADFFQELDLYEKGLYGDK